VINTLFLLESAGEAIVSLDPTTKLPRAVLLLNFVQQGRTFAMAVDGHTSRLLM
jgi:hypothetical protein